MPLRCPVCKADNAQGPSCRRCKADLTALFTLEEHRACAMALAQQSAREGKWHECRIAAERAHGLRSDEQSRGMLAASKLLCGDFSGALALANFQEPSV